MPAHPLTNFDILNYCRWKKGFNEVFRKSNLPETIKNGSSYVINLGEKK